MKNLKQYGRMLFLCGILACGNFVPTPAFASQTPDGLPTGQLPAGHTGADAADVSANHAVADTADIPGDFVPSHLPCPEFSAEAGFYEDEFLLTLTVPKNFQIYVTTDGSLPSPDNDAAFCYREPILLTDLREADEVSKAWVVRAATFTPEGEGGDTITKSYFIGKGMTTRYAVPVVSLVTDPDNLYSETDGIYIHYGESGRDWERPFHFEYFTPGGGCAVSINCGGRVHGGASREADLKSLRLYARAQYDTKKNFKYDLFTGGTLPALDVNGKTIKKFKHLILRGGGNEATAWERIYFRDTLAAWCMRDTGLDIQAAQPLVAFLNGNYYGIMNLRERQDDRYIEEHYGLDHTQVAIYNFWYDEKGDIRIEADAETDALAGQAKQYYEEIFRFATTADLSVAENYEKVCQAFDIPNYIDYLCIELFCGNTDWPGNNCRAWRYMGGENELYGSDGKVRWLLYDTEFGFGLYGRHPSDDNVAAALSATSTEWPNQHGSTLLLRSLLANEDFYSAFLSRLLDLLNEEFVSDALIAQVDLMAEYYRDLIQENIDAGNRFGNYESNLSAVKDYIKKRPAYFYTLLYQNFELGARYTLHIDFDTSMGSLAVGTLQAKEGANCIRENGFYGFYYNGYPVKVTAVPAKGYRFVGFTGKGISALAAGDGTKISPADAPSHNLLHYMAEDDTAAAIFTQDTVFVENAEANGQIYLTAVFEKEDAAPSYLDRVGATATLPGATDQPPSGMQGISEPNSVQGADGQADGQGADGQVDGAQGTDGVADGAQGAGGQADGAQGAGGAQSTDGLADGTQGADNQTGNTQDGTEFILLCILLVVALAFVTFLGIRASKRCFRR